MDFLILAMKPPYNGRPKWCILKERAILKFKNCRLIVQNCIKDMCTLALLVLLLGNVYTPTPMSVHRRKCEYLAVSMASCTTTTRKKRKPQDHQLNKQPHLRWWKALICKAIQMLTKT